MKYNTVSTALNAAKLITLVLAVYAQLAFAIPLRAATPHLPPLKTGDIAFQNSSGSAREAIIIASGSPYTHVGIVEIDAKKRPSVIEAVGPRRYRGIAKNGAQVLALLALAADAERVASSKS